MRAGEYAGGVRESTTLTVARQPLRSPLEVRLSVLNVHATPKTLVLREGSCLVGAGPGCDIVVEDTMVSRRHAVFELAPEGVRVRDLGSRNGSYYLGQRFETITLGLGSRVSLGRTQIAVSPSEGAFDLGPEGASHYEELIGASPVMQQLYAKLTRLEGSLVNVLVEGESGTGKELVARAIHRRCRVSDGPFVAVNCGAMAKDLVRSELFGHKRGAFTGAGEARAGAFESADGGTLLLDEIGELPLDVQPVLLRALETGEVCRLGEDHPRKVKVRIVAATHVDLAAHVERGAFREDLYYRIKVVRLRVPSLRERPEDVPALVAHFAREAGAPEVEHDLFEFETRSWPGNVRELKHAVQAFLAIGDLPESSRTADHSLEMALAAIIDLDRSFADSKEALLQRFTRLYLQRLMARTGGNQSEAARIAKLDRTYFGKLVARFGPGAKGAVTGAGD